MQRPTQLLLFLAVSCLAQVQLSDLLKTVNPAGQIAGAGRRSDLPSFSVVDSTFHLSSGDQFRLRWWGTGTGDIDLAVDTRGDLVIPDLGRIHARGRTLRTVRDSVERLIRSTKKATLIDLQIVKAVSPQVRISGLVTDPGLYEVPAGSRLSQVLPLSGVVPSVAISIMASGDPIWSPSLPPFPSLRKVLIVRGEGDSSWYDLVQALRTGDPSQDPSLSFGDRIVIFPRGPIVNISGGANHPGGIEYVPGESVKKLLAVAGENPFPAPYLEGGSGPDLNQPMTSEIKLIRFPPKAAEPTSQIVWILGRVPNPGAYSITAGMTANDLVQKAGGIFGGQDSGVAVAIKRGWNYLGAGRQRSYAEATQYPEVKLAMLSYLVQANGTYSDPKTPLQPGDSVLVHPAEQVVWVGGKVSKQGFVPWKKGLQIQDYIQIAGGYSDRAWESRTRLFDLHSGLASEIEDKSIVRPGSAIIVPERRYIPPEQWVNIAVSVLSLGLTATTLYLTVSK
ncbi:MAG TPA: SLBB domain-containing protein [Fibrobacteria bacterium]|nr:SLBB domain-containing protein [Fibrobacteria bacterium]